MKANELMIGDWYAFRGHPYKCTASDIASIAECEEKGVPTDISEIPLTPEILEKNGFVTEWDEDVKLMVCDTIEIEIGNRYQQYKDGKMYLSRVLAPLYYVHELQHALRLCGIEKEIEL